MGGDIGRRESSRFPPDPVSRTRYFMGGQELSVRKKRGRPPGRVRPPTAALRLPQELLERVDLWAVSEPDSPTRPEAVRRLVEKGLSRALKGRR
jgi:hypothetical protein